MLKLFYFLKDSFVLDVFIFLADQHFKIGQKLILFIYFCLKIIKQALYCRKGGNFVSTSYCYAAMSFSYLLDTALKRAIVELR